MCHDYYIFLPSVNEKSAFFKQFDKKVHEHYEYLFFANGLLLRIFSADILDRTDLIPSGELNNIIDFSDQYYTYIKSCKLSYSDNVLFAGVLSGKYDKNETVDIMKQLTERSDKILTYIKAISLYSTGIYLKKVGLNNEFNDNANNSIIHCIESLYDLQIESKRLGTDYKIKKDPSIKEKFNERMLEIINI